LAATQERVAAISAGVGSTAKTVCGNIANAIAAAIVTVIDNLRFVMFASPDLDYDFFL
jgi:microcompartment protein CcmK/EutM